MWEYGILAQVIPMKPEFYRLPPGQVAEQFMRAIQATNILAGLNNVMNNPPGENNNPGEIISHHLTVVGPTLLLTILYRQLKP